MQMCSHANTPGRTRSRHKSAREQRHSAHAYVSQHSLLFLSYSFQCDADTIGSDEWHGTVPNFYASNTANGPEFVLGPILFGW